MKNAKRKTSPVLRRILLAVIGLILGVNVYFANASGIGGNHLPMPFGYGIANVLSGSMEPTFSKGALLLVKEEKQTEPGQIVVYQSGQVLRSYHRFHLAQKSLRIHWYIGYEKDQWRYPCSRSVGHLKPENQHLHCLLCCR